MKQHWSSRGALTVVAMFVLGGAVLAGLFLAPRGRSPRSPYAPLGVPSVALRFAAADFFHNRAESDRIIHELQELKPDYAFFEEIELEQVTPISAALGMQQTFYPQLFQRPKDIDPNRSWPGVCVLSRRPLYDAVPLATPDRRTFGVWATSVVGGKKFAVACVYLASGGGGLDVSRRQDEQLKTLTQAWENAGRPPAVIAGNFGHLSMAATSAAVHRFPDLLTTPRAVWAGGSASPTIEILLSNDWTLTDRGVIRGSSPESAPLWMSVAPAAP